MDDKAILFTLFVAAGALLTGLSVPLMLGKIRPNMWYGFRVAKTLENPQVWYAANRYAARRLCVAGISIILGAVGLSLAPGLSLDAFALGCLAIFVLVFGIGLVQSFVYLWSL